MQRVVRLLTLPGDQKDSITALDSRDNCVFLGTSNGLLQKWRLDEEQKDGGDEVEYISRQLCTVQLSKKKPVMQIRLDSSWPRLFALCEEMVTQHDTEDLQMVQQITDNKSVLKGCICIAVAPQHKGVHRLAVATRRKLLVYTYRAKDNTHHLFQELVMPSAVCSLAFQAETLCCGLAKEYSLLNCYSGAATGVFSLTNQQPNVHLLESEQIALARVGNMSIMISMRDPGLSGSVTRETIRWSSEPKGVGFKHPYIIGMLADRVEVYSMYECEIVQVLTNITGAMLATVRCPGVKDNLCIATKQDVFMLIPFPIEVQLKGLVDKLMKDAAFDLLYRNSTGDDTADQKWREDTHIALGFAFLFFGQPDSAFEHFAATTIDVREVLLHFPFLLPPNANEPGGVLDGWESSCPSNSFSVPLEDRWAGLQDDQNQRPPNDRSDGDPQARSPIHQGSITESDCDSITSAGRSKAVGKMMEHTIDMLLLFLSARRQAADPVQQRCIDYATLIVALDRNDKKEAYALLSAHNHCSLQECSLKLQELGMYRELALLYRAKNEISLAREALQKGDRIHEFCARAGATSTLEDLYHDPKVDLHEIFTAIESKNPSYISKLLSTDPSLANLADSNGNTPLHHAMVLPPTPSTDTPSLYGDPVQVQILGILIGCGANNQARNASGISPLDMARAVSPTMWGLLRSMSEMYQLTKAAAG